MGEPADANLETGQPMADRPREFAHVERVATHQDEVAIDAVGGHLDEMPKGYYYSAKFLGTFAVSLPYLLWFWKLANGALPQGLKHRFDIGLLELQFASRYPVDYQSRPWSHFRYQLGECSFA
jgi:hypothetical protein